MANSHKNSVVQPSLPARRLYDDVLRQTYVRQCAELLWQRKFNDTEKRMLGGTFSRAIDDYPYAPLMWAKAKSVSFTLAVIEVAETLGLLASGDADWLRREGGELPLDPAEARDVAIERGDLVLSCRERRFHWNGREYEVPLTKHPVLWDFLLTVCRAAKRSEAVDSNSFGDSKRENYVTQTKSSLAKLPGFPLDLLDLFVSEGPQRQRLDLPAERIHILD